MAANNSLFAVFGVTDPSTVEGSLERQQGWIFQPVGSGQWFIYAPAGTTSKEISDGLGFVRESSSDGVVVRVESYFGKKSPAVWDWLAAKAVTELGTTSAAK